MKTVIMKCSGESMGMVLNTQNDCPFGALVEKVQQGSPVNRNGTLDYVFAMSDIHL